MASPMRRPLPAHLPKQRGQPARIELNVLRLDEDGNSLYDEDFDPTACHCFPNTSSLHIPSMLYDHINCPHHNTKHIQPAQAQVFAYPWTAATNKRRQTVGGGGRKPRSPADDSMVSDKLSLIEEEPRTPFVIKTAPPFANPSVFMESKGEPPFTAPPYSRWESHGGKAEKYKVRPSSGIVKPGSIEKVYVYLYQEHHLGVDKDKFLIMAVELNGDPPDNMSEYWKTVPRENIMDHRLRCVQVKRSDSRYSGDTVSVLSADDQITALNSKVDSLMEGHLTLQKSIRLLILLQVLTLVLFIVFILYTYLYANSGPPQVKAEEGPQNSSTADRYCSGTLF